DFYLSDGTTPDQFTFITSSIVDLRFNHLFGYGTHEIFLKPIESFNPDINEQWKSEEGLSVAFNRFEEFQPGDIVINEFMVRPPEGYPRYVEIYNRSERYLNLKGFELRRREHSPNNGGILSTNDLAIGPGRYIVVTSNREQLEEIFGKGSWREMSGYPGFTQTTSDEIRLIEPNGAIIQKLEYNPQTWGGNGVALERRSLDAPINDINNWANSIADLKGTPGMKNSVGPDDAGPFLKRFEVIDNEIIHIYLGGAVDWQKVTPSNFHLTGNQSIQKIGFIEPDIVKLTLATKLISGQTYLLTIRDIVDIFGNEMGSVQQSFTYYLVESADRGDVVINEFMYNEPDDYSRYIELYNRSQKVIDLAGWKQANNTGTLRTLTDESYLLQPGAYVVIAPNEELLQVFLFPELPLINAGNRLSALKNGGDAIVIANESGVVIDSLVYTPDWGGDGVSLERRRADLSGTHRENWDESPSTKLGTPGQKNEVDSQFVFQAESVYAPARNEVDIRFNASVREGSVHVSHFIIEGISPSTAVFMNPGQIKLTFAKPFDSGEKSLQISGLQSLAGFTVKSDTTYSFMVFDPFQPGDIKINEFMVRPPEGTPRYVELVNGSGRLINLRDWRLQRRNTSSENPRFISEYDLPIHPGDYIVLTENSDQLSDIFGAGHYVELTNFPPFTVSVPDQIRLINGQDLVTDSLEYNPSIWGGNGVALERLSIDVASHIVENWRESAAILHGTPGKPNSVKPDTEPPVLMSVKQADNRSFILEFDKKPEQNSVLDISNYSFNPFLHISEIISDQNRVQIIVESGLENDQTYDLTLQNIHDIFGNRMETTTVSVHYLEFSDIEPMKVVINEILYRRAQSGAPQFVELFNQSSDNFNLSGWSLTNKSGMNQIPEGVVIRENEYLVFSDSESLVSESGSESGRFIHLPGFKSFNSSGDLVVLKDKDGMVIDSLTYKAAWRHNPPGVSLERKDPAALSVDPFNWVKSVAETGSTPAEINSLFQIDESPPEVVFANLFHPDSLEVIFNKFVDLKGIKTNHELKRRRKSKQTGNLDETEELIPRFLINGISTTLLKYLPEEGNRIVLDPTVTDLIDDIRLEIQNLGDFKGNIVQSLDQPVSRPAETGDLLFNEIMYQPLADNRDGFPDQSDYIEIFNRKPYPISLEGIFLHDAPDENGNIVKMEPVTTRHQWVAGHGYLLIYPETDERSVSESRVGRFFGLVDESDYTVLRVDRNTLSLPNTGRQINLSDSTLNVIDYIDYSPDWHNPNLIDTRGMALERISPNSETNREDNWSSSADIMGGTPGKQNSIFQLSEVLTDNNGINLDPNPFSPDGDGHEDHLFIHYLFDEPDYLVRIRIFDRYGRLVRNLVNSEAAGNQGFYIWDGRMDNGQTNRIGIYIILIEAFNSSTGRNLQFKETVVIARKF
ncbi:MAG: lamin tail domain-containing protein, partial [Balneolaceae bacterium]